MDSFLGNTRPFFQGLPSSTRGYDGSPDDPNNAPPNPTPPATPTLQHAHPYHSYHPAVGGIVASAATSLPGHLPPSRPITPATPSHKSGDHAASSYSVPSFLAPPSAKPSLSESRYLDSILKASVAVSTRAPNPMPDPHALPSSYSTQASLLLDHRYPNRPYSVQQVTTPDSRTFARTYTTQAPSLADTRPTRPYSTHSGLKMDPRTSVRPYGTLGVPTSDLKVYPHPYSSQALPAEVRSHYESTGKYLPRSEGRSDLRVSEAQATRKSDYYLQRGQPYRTPEAKPLENLAPSVQISTTPNTVNGSKDALYLGIKADDIVGQRRSEDPFIRSSENLQVNGSRDPLYPNGSHPYSSSSRRESSLERPTSSHTKEDSALDLSVKTVRQTPDSTAPDPEKNHSASPLSSSSGDRLLHSDPMKLLPGSVTAPSSSRASKEPSPVSRITSGISVAPRATPPGHIPSPYGINGSPSPLSSSSPLSRVPHVLPPAKRPGDPSYIENNTKLPRRSHSPSRSGNSSRQPPELHYPLHSSHKEPTTEQNRGLHLAAATLSSEHDSRYGREPFPDRRQLSLERKDPLSESNIERRISRDPSIERGDLRYSNRDHSTERRHPSQERRDPSIERRDLDSDRRDLEKWHMMDAKYLQAKQSEIFDPYKAWLSHAEQSKANSSKAKYPPSVPTTLPQHAVRVPHAQPPHPYSTYGRPPDSLPHHTGSHTLSSTHHLQAASAAQSKLYPPHSQSSARRGPQPPVSHASSHLASQPSATTSVTQAYPYPYVSTQAMSAHYHQQLQRQHSASQYPPFTHPQQAKSAAPPSLAPPHQGYPFPPHRTDPALALYPPKRPSQVSPHPASSPHSSISPHPSASPLHSASPHSSVSPHPLAASPRPGVSPHPSQQGRTPQSSPHPAHRLPTSSPVQLSSHTYPGSLPPSPYQSYSTHSTPPSRPPSATAPPHTPSPHHSKSPGVAHALQPPTSHPLQPPMSHPLQPPHHARPSDPPPQDQQSQAISTLRQLSETYSQKLQQKLQQSTPSPSQQTRPPQPGQPQIQQSPATSLADSHLSQVQPNASQANVPQAPTDLAAHPTSHSTPASLSSSTTPPHSTNAAVPSTHILAQSTSAPTVSTHTSTPTHTAAPSTHTGTPTPSTQVPTFSTHTPTQPTHSLPPTLTSVPTYAPSPSIHALATSTPAPSPSTHTPATSTHATTTTHAPTPSSHSPTPTQAPTPPVHALPPTHASAPTHVPTPTTQASPTTTQASSHTPQSTEMATRAASTSSTHSRLPAPHSTLAPTPSQAISTSVTATTPTTYPSRTMPSSTHAPHLSHAHPTSPRAPPHSIHGPSHSGQMTYPMHAPPYTTHAPSQAAHPYQHHYAQSHLANAPHSARPPHQSSHPHYASPHPSSTQSYSGHSPRHSGYPGPTPSAHSPYSNYPMPYHTSASTPSSHMPTPNYAPHHSSSSLPRSTHGPPNSAHISPHSTQPSPYSTPGAPHTTLAPSQQSHAPTQSTHAPIKSAHVSPSTQAPTHPPHTTHAPTHPSQIPPHTARAPPHTTQASIHPSHTTHASMHGSYPPHTAPRTTNAPSHSSHVSPHAGHALPHTAHAQSHAGYPPHPHHPSSYPSQTPGYPPHTSHSSQVPPHPSYPSHATPHPSQSLHHSQIHPYPGQSPSHPSQTSSYAPHPSQSSSHPYSQSYPHPYPYSSHSQGQPHSGLPTRPTQPTSQSSQVSPRSVQPHPHSSAPGHHSSHPYPHQSQPYPHPSHPYPHSSQNQGQMPLSHPSRTHTTQPSTTSAPLRGHPHSIPTTRPHHPSQPGYQHPPGATHSSHRPPHPQPTQHPHYNSPRFPHPHVKTEDAANASQYPGYNYPPQYAPWSDAGAARANQNANTIKQPEYPSPNSRTPLDPDQSRIRTKGEQKSFDPRNSVGGTSGVKQESWPAYPSNAQNTAQSLQSNTGESQPEATKVPVRLDAPPEEGQKAAAATELKEDNKGEPYSNKTLEPGKAALAEKLHKKIQRAESFESLAAKKESPQEPSQTKKEEPAAVVDDWDMRFDKLMEDLATNPEGVTSKKSKTLGRRYLQKVQIQQAIDNDLIAPPPSYVVEEEEEDSEPEPPVKFRGKFKSIKDKKVERLILTYASHSDESATEMIPDEDASDFEEELKREIRSKDKKRGHTKKVSKSYDSSGSDSGKKEKDNRKGSGRGRNKENKPNNKQDLDSSYSSSSSSSSSNSDSSDDSDSSNDSDSEESELEEVPRSRRRGGKVRRKFESESSDSEDEVVTKRRTRRYRSSSEEKSTKKQSGKKRKKKQESSDSDDVPLKTRRGKRKKKWHSEEEEESVGTRRGKKKGVNKKQQKRRKHDTSDEESEEDVKKTHSRKKKALEGKKVGRRKQVGSDSSSSESEDVSSRRSKNETSQKKSSSKKRLKKRVEESSDNSDIPTKKKSPTKGSRIIDSDDIEDTRRKSDNEEKEGKVATEEEGVIKTKMEIKDTLIKKENIKMEPEEVEEETIEEEIGDLEEEEDGMDLSNDSVIEKLKKARDEELNREDVKEMQAWFNEVNSDIKKQLGNLQEITFRHCWKKPQFGAGDDFLQGWQMDVKKYKEKTARFPKKLCQAAKHQGVSSPTKGSPKKGRDRDVGKDSPHQQGTSSPAKNTRSKSGIIKTNIVVAEDDKLKVAARPEISAVMERFFEKVLSSSDNDCTKGGIASKKFNFGPFSPFGTQRTPTGLTPTPSVAPSMMASDDSDLDSLASLRTDLPASDSIPISKRSIASSLLKKIGRKYSDKKISSLYLNKSRSILEATNKPQLLPTPGIPTTEEDLKDMTPDQIKIATFFRKETVSNYRDNFEVIVTKNGINEFTPILYQSRTRKKTKQIQDAATVKSVFGSDIPPHLVKKAEENKAKKQLKKAEKKEEVRRSVKDESSPVPVSRASTPAGSILAVGDEDEDSELRSERSESVLGESLVPQAAKKVRRKLRKFRSGFDYIRKKKKVKPDDEATPSRKRLPVRKHVNWPEQSRDVASEVRTWVVNKGLGETVLHKAARLQYHDVVVYCAESPDFDINVRDNAGYTPLHEACNRGHLDIAQVLCAHGAHVNAPGYKGMRPLHEAVENGHGELARLLLAYGADPALTTYAGQTCLALCADPLTTRLVQGYIADLKARPGEMWSFTGPARLFDPDEQGCDVFSSIPTGNIAGIQIKVEAETNGLQSVINLNLKQDLILQNFGKQIQDKLEKLTSSEEIDTLKLDNIKKETLTDDEDNDKAKASLEGEPKGQKEQTITTIEEKKEKEAEQEVKENENTAVLKKVTIDWSEKPLLDLYQVYGRPHQYYLLSQLLTILSVTRMEFIIAANTIETLELSLEEFENRAHSCILGSCSRGLVSGQTSVILVRVTPTVNRLLGLDTLII